MRMAPKPDAIIDIDANGIAGARPGTMNGEPIIGIGG